MIDDKKVVVLKMFEPLNNVVDSFGKHVNIENLSWRGNSMGIVSLNFWPYQYMVLYYICYFSCPIPTKMHRLLFWWHKCLMKNYPNKYGIAKIENTNKEKRFTYVNINHRPEIKW